MPNTNLLTGLIVVEGNLQVLDRDSLVMTDTFPHIGDATNDDWVITHSDDLTGCKVRGWQGGVVTADGL